MAAADYLVTFREGKEPEVSWKDRVEEFLAQPQILKKKTKRSEKQVDIRPLYLSDGSKRRWPVSHAGLCKRQLYQTGAGDGKLCLLAWHGACAFRLPDQAAGGLCEYGNRGSAGVCASGGFGRRR